MTNENVLPENEHIWQEITSWKPNNQQKELFQQVYTEIITANKYLNLTRITEPEDFLEKHIWDSLAPLFFLNFPVEKVIDIGTGAGFPGIPVAIAFSDYEVTLLDSTTKKINFLTDLTTKLKIENVRTLIGRVEAIGKQEEHREQYDLALIRAVSKISVCIEYALPLLKKGGIVVLYRGSLSVKEIKKAQKVAQKLSGIVLKTETFTTPLTQGIRNCIYIKKIGLTSFDFPRDVGKAAKNPL